MDELEIIKKRAGLTEWTLPVDSSRQAEFSEKVNTALNCARRASRTI